MIRRAPSDLHKKLQIFLKNEFTDTVVELEKPFSSICRIADVVFIKEKVVVEIQTSLLRISEMLERQEDYKKIGFSVIWLLHNEVFLNKNRPLVTRFFYNKVAFGFSLGPKNRFIFYDLDLKQVPLKTLLRPPPLYEQIFRFLFGF
jgi:competence CoiA-like predicted nuclease